MISFADKLLDWYAQAHRPLPWRLTPLPYYILVSEFMLQQTRMETVLPYFDRFIKAFPTIESLAQANEAELLKLWEGLGYYRRVRHLAQTAKVIVADYGGIIPSDPKILKTLPGIGDYVAGAIASTAYQVKVSALDGNVIRILSRLDCLADDVTRSTTRKVMQSRLLELLPDERVGDFNQALMELGALICLPNGVPNCQACPIQSDCCAYHQGNPQDYPVKPAKKTSPIEPKTILVIRSSEMVCLEQFEPGLLEGLWRFPMIDGHLTMAEVQARYPTATVRPLPASRHVFSHKVWDMIGYEVWQAQVDQGTPLNELADKTFPTALKVYRELV